jgi:CheY-specific phosphatase CheX/CheY-like chemotaxis protein
MKIRVLVVDDSPFIHKAIARALPDEDYEICGSGKNGQEGVELYKKLHPDVVTMDITMPIMDGLAAAKEIIGIDPEARIIMLSAMGDEEIAQDARAIGIRALLQKPFKTPEVISAINEVCSSAGNGPESAPGPVGERGYLECFQASLKYTLKEMADLDCSFGEVVPQQGILASRGLAVILGITGEISGRVILDTSREAACRLCEMMSGEEPRPGDDFVLFSMAELLNILSGHAITDINNMHRGFNLRLGPPSVFVGNSLNINSPKVNAEIIKAETAAGDIYLSVGFEGR